MKEIKFEAKPFIQTRLEKDLQEWVTPITEQILLELGVNNNPAAKSKLVVSDQFGERAYHQSCSTFKDDGSEITYNHIILPTRLVDDAKNSRERQLTLLSGEKIDVPSETILRHILTEELTHCYFPRESRDLDEANANLKGWEQIAETEGGQKYLACAISTLLVEANILGLADIHEFDGHKLPIKLQDSTLEKINQELDLYFADPRELKIFFTNIKKNRHGKWLMIWTNIPKGL